MALLLFLTVVLTLALTASVQAKDPQLVPRRLSSTGDSLTAGGSAEHYGPNPNASWVNGYYGYWQRLLGLTNVRSHNQRITARWGPEGRANYMNAFGGADMFDFPAQAARAVYQQAQYVTVLMGHNDVCQDNVWEIPSDEQFETNFRAGMELLRQGLPNGATIYVLGIADISRLYGIAREKEALGIVDCETLWTTNPLDWFPCRTMLDPSNTEADREYVRGRNIAFNEILQRVTAEYQAGDQHHYYYFTESLFVYPLIESDISDLDCFHPSAQGQRTISQITWADLRYLVSQDRN